MMLSVSTFNSLIGIREIVKVEISLSICAAASFAFFHNNEIQYLKICSIWNLITFPDPTIPILSGEALLYMRYCHIEAYRWLHFVGRHLSSICGVVPYTLPYHSLLGIIARRYLVTTCLYKTILVGQYKQALFDTTGKWLYELRSISSVKYDRPPVHHEASRRKRHCYFFASVHSIDLEVPKTNRVGFMVGNPSTVSNPHS